MRKIDVHIHIGKLLYSRPGLRVRDLLNWMDTQDIEIAWVQAIENPEEVDYYVTSERVLRSCRSHADRLIPFCNVDPRRGDPNSFDPLPILSRFVERGARGFGEMLAGLAIDDPRQMKLYAACQELGLPVLIHIDRYRNWDALGLPGLEKVLRTFPNLTVIAHALHWWSEISADVQDTDRFDYPRRPVVPGGRAEFLLRTYPNLFADLSAQSGFNALTRDLNFTPDFLRRNQEKLLFGSDLVFRGQTIPLPRFLEALPVEKSVLEKIFARNAQKIISV